MRAMSYERIIPFGNDEVVYVISNGTHMTAYDMSPCNSSNCSHPSLVVQAESPHNGECTELLLQWLNEQVWEYNSTELSASDIGELCQAILGKPSSWKLTSIRLSGQGLYFELHNFGRHCYEIDQANKFPNDDEGKQAYWKWAKSTPSYHALLLPMTQFPAPFLIVKEFNKKGKMKRRYVFDFIRGGKEIQKGCTIAQVKEYSIKHLEREISFILSDDGSDTIFAEITEFQY